MIQTVSLFYQGENERQVVRYIVVKRSRGTPDLRRVQTCLALQKLKQGGTQRVEVRYQQVNVNEGGQAVVTERVNGRGSRKPGRGGRNGK